MLIVRCPVILIATDWATPARIMLRTSAGDPRTGLMSDLPKDRLHIAARLRRAREAARLTQGQAAQILSLHRPAISEVENLFLDPGVTALDEYGIPFESARKIERLKTENNLPGAFYELPEAAARTKHFQK